MSLRGGSCSGSCRCPGARQRMQRPSMLCFPPASARGLVAEATVFSEVWLPRAICSTSPEGAALSSEHGQSTLPVLWLTGEEGFDVLEVGKCPVRLATFVGKEEGKVTHDGRRPLDGRIAARPSPGPPGPFARVDHEIGECLHWRPQSLGRKADDGRRYSERPRRNPETFCS